MSKNWLHTGAKMLTVEVAVISLFILPAGIYAAATIGKTMTSNSRNSLQSGLVAHYTFDGNDLVQNVKDRGSSGTDLQLVNFTTGTTTVAGRVGQALYFSADALNTMATSSTAVVSNEPLTLCAWFYPDYPGGLPASFSRYIVSLSDGATAALTDHFALIFASADSGGSAVRAVAAATNTYASSTGNPAVNQKWQHACGVFESSTSRTLYQDGVAMPKDTTTKNPAAIDETLIGASGMSNLALAFNGSIDDVRIYNRALSADEVKRVYGLGATSYVAATPESGLAAPIKAIGDSTGLVGHWTFDGPDLLQNAVDKSGNGNTGRLINMSTTTVTGKVGQALTFDASDDWINAGSATSLDNLSAITSCTWVNMQSISTYSNVLSKSTDGSDGWGLYLRNSSEGFGFLSRENDYREYFTPMTNRWQHICATWTGANGNASITLYLNGESVSSDAADVAGTLDDSTFNFAIGATDGGAAFPFGGYLDDARVYNRALSAAEVKRIYEIGATSKVAVTPQPSTPSKAISLSNGLVAHYTFDGPRLLANATDSSGNGNHGYLFNFELGTSSAQVAGKIGQALLFDNNDDDIDLGSAVLLTSGTPFTISWWEKVTSDAALYPDRMVLDIGGTSNNFNISRVQDGEPSYSNIAWGPADGSTAVMRSTAAPTVTASVGKWVHFVITGTNPNSFTTTDYKLYANGESVAVIQGDSFGAVAENDIGSSAHNAGTNAALDDIRVYNRALSADEVKRLYQLGQ